MFEQIGESIRASLAELTWISRTGGATVPIEIRDGETFKTFPGCLAYEGAPCEAGQFVNLAPDSSESCIAFIEFLNDVTVVRHTSRYDDISFQFRVVLWWDARKIAFDGDEVVEWGIIERVIAKVKAANIENTVFGAARVQYLSAQFTPDQIWGRYNIQTQGQGLFMYPYRTMGLNFNVRGRLNLKCLTGTITADADAC